MSAHVHVHIDFTVYGEDVVNLQANALEYLNKLMPDREWEYTLEIRPVAYFGGLPFPTWQADVSAYPKAPT